MKPNGRTRNANSELDPNTATLRIVDLRHDLELAIAEARTNAELKVRARFAAKEKAIMERVGPCGQSAVERRVAVLLAEEGVASDES